MVKATEEKCLRSWPDAHRLASSLLLAIHGRSLPNRCTVLVQILHTVGSHKCQLSRQMPSQMHPEMSFTNFLNIYQFSKVEKSR